MKKEIHIHFEKIAYEEYSRLASAVRDKKKSRSSPSYSQLLQSIDKTVLDLKRNPHLGDLIPRKYLNKSLIARYGTDKLFRMELVGYWRMIYTIIGYETKIIAIILEYMDHNTYNKRFNYKKR